MDLQKWAWTDTKDGSAIINNIEQILPSSDRIPVLHFGSAFLPTMEESHVGETIARKDDVNCFC